jgi:hypothetical protein
MFEGARRASEHQKALPDEARRVNEMLIGEVRRSNDYPSRVVAAIEKKDSQISLTVETISECFTCARRLCLQPNPPASPVISACRAHDKS